MTSTWVASYAGNPNNAAWYLNLTPDPNVIVQVGTEVFSARARDATAAERPVLWERMLAINPGYAGYDVGDGRPPFAPARSPTTS